MLNASDETSFHLGCSAQEHTEHYDAFDRSQGSPTHSYTTQQPVLQRDSFNNQPAQEHVTSPVTKTQVPLTSRRVPPALHKHKHSHSLPEQKTLRISFDDVIDDEKAQPNENLASENIEKEANESLSSDSPFLTPKTRRLSEKRRLFTKSASEGATARMQTNRGGSWLSSSWLALKRGRRMFSRNSQDESEADRKEDAKKVGSTLLTSHDSVMNAVKSGIFLFTGASLMRMTHAFVYMTLCYE